MEMKKQIEKFKILDEKEKLKSKIVFIEIELTNKEGEL